MIRQKGPHRESDVIEAGEKYPSNYSTVPGPSQC